MGEGGGRAGVRGVRAGDFLGMGREWRTLRFLTSEALALGMTLADSNFRTFFFFASIFILAMTTEDLVDLKKRVF